MKERPKSGLADFDWQIRTLFEVLGAHLTAEQMKNAYVAQVLGIEPSGVTQRRNGKTALRIGEAAKIVDHYGLNIYGLDHRLFDIDRQERFLQELKDHGVGIYETNPRRRLAGALDAALVTSGLSVDIREARGMRGISYDLDDRKALRVFRVGQRVEIIVRASEGSHIAVVQRILDLDYVMETLAPTATLPDTFTTEPTLVLPGNSSVGLTIRNPTGPYKLLAIEGDEDLIALFAGGQLDLLKDGAEQIREFRPVRITDQIAKTILEQLEDRNCAIRCAAFEYIIA